MKSNKKVLLVLASVVLAGILSGCNANNPSSNNPSSNNPTSSQVTSTEPSSSASSNPTSSEAPHTHTYGAWTITTAPTATETGTATRSCTDSDDTETATVPVLTDTSVWSVKSTTPATCEAAGSVTYTSTYGDVTVTLDALNHAYGAWTLVTNPTLETAGSAKRVCSNDATHVETTSVPALTDTSVWSVKSTTPATCTEDGNVVYTSTYGDVTVVVNATNHAYGEWSIKTAPTLEAAGSAEKVCANDQGHKETQNLPVLTDTSVWSVKANVAPTCDNAGSVTYTSTYGDVTITVPATGHSYGNWEITLAPTEVATGTAKKVCANDATHMVTETIPVLTDTSVWTVSAEVAPKCEVPGSKTYTSVYGNVTVEVASTGHKYGEWSIDVNPTLNEIGLASRVCEHDEEHFEEVDVPALSDTSVWTLSSETAPTLTSKGSKTYTSTYGTVTIEVPSLSDTAVWSVAVEDATCEADGKATYTSSLYGTVEVVLPQLGHAYGAWEFDVAPTESTAGHAIKVCANADHPITLDVPALSDTSFWTIDADASSEPGCGVAGKTVYINAENEIAYEIEVAALSHQGEWTITVMPTDTTPGVISRVCTNCTTPEEVEIPALSTADAYVVTRVEPTTSSIGTVTYTYVTTDNQQVSVTHYLYLITENAGLPFVTIDHRDSKTFVDDGTGRFVSNNTGISSSSAYIDFFFSAPGKLTLDYVISSESRYDKGNIYYQGGSGTSYGNIKKDLSGESSDSLSLTFTGEGVEYNKIYFSYSKDSSGNKGSDTFTVYNLVFETTVKLENKTLTYNTNGGTEIAATTVYKGAGISLPTAPTKEGAFFAGWYLDEGLTQALTNTYVVENDVTLYAKWVDPVTLTFNVNGGTDVSAIEGLEPGSSITLPAAPTKEGVYFVGWYVDEACTEEFNPSTGISTNTTIYAKWREPVVLTFDVDGGTAVDSVSTDINVAITTPTAPTKENHRFDGWYTDDTFTTTFDFSAGITENTTAYAKWVESVKVTIYHGTEVVTIATIDKGANYSVELPSDFTAGKEITVYTDEELENAYVDGTVIDENTTLYVKVTDLTSLFAPSGVISQFVNGHSDESNKTPYEWNIIPGDGSATFVSATKGVHNSCSGAKFVLAKESILTFDYIVSTESNYDILTVVINGEQVYTSKVTGNKVQTGTFSRTLAANDVVEIFFVKDGSGYENEDMVTLSNLKFTDGVPTSSITYVYNDGITESVNTSVNYGAALEDTHLTAPTNVRGENYQFEGWYIDEALTTKATTSTTVNNENFVLYARWLEKVTVTFVVPEGATTVEDANVWTYTALDVENPTLAGHIFRGWYADEEFEIEVDLNEGVSQGMTLYAKFESAPVGSSKVEANEIVLEDGSASMEISTTEEFTTYYFSFSPETTDTYYFLFDTNSISNKQYGSDKPYHTYDSDAKFSIVDSEETVVKSETSFSSSLVGVSLEVGKTYYIAARLGSNYKAWGDFALQVEQFSHDTTEEAIEYTFGTKASSQGLFEYAGSSHKLVYSFTTDENIHGDYLIAADGSGWGSATVYSDSTLSTQVVYVTHTAGKISFKNITLEANKTYYVVLGQNWSNSDLTTKETTFQISEYEQGYVSSNPDNLVIGETLTVELTGGNDHYYSVELESNTTLKVDISGGAEYGTKQVYIYSSTDLSTPLFELTHYGIDLVYGYVNLDAGSYVVKANYSATTYTNSYELVVSVADEGSSILNPIEITLPTTDGDIDGISSITANGTYYSFTTGESLWHFFTSSASSSNVKIIKYVDGTETVVHEGAGSARAKLDANSDYVLFVSNSEDVDATIAHATLTEFRDGSSKDSAIIVDLESGVYDLECPIGLSNQKSYSVWYQIDITEENAGSYKIYSSNNGSIDTKGYLYSIENTSSSIKSNDDVGASNMGSYGCGYKFDFAFTYELTAGSYLVNITYTIYPNNTATSLTLNVEKA